MMVFYVYLAFLLLGAVFYGYAAASQSVSEDEIEKCAQEGDKGAKLFLSMQEGPKLTLGILPALLLTGATVLGLFWPEGVSRWVMLPVLALSVSFLLAYRRAGTYLALPFIRHHAGLIWALSRVLLPFTFLVHALAKVACVPFGIATSREGEAVTEEEIISMVDEAHEQGVIEENEAEMIANVIAFNETQAHEIMTHRTGVIAFDKEVSLSEMVEVMMEAGKSRYPVYEGSLDNIFGIVHYKDALKFIMKNSWARYEKLSNIPGLIRQATLIPETRSIADLFSSMQLHKAHMAIVVDEYGQTAGIVSMEDILEEIVGDILDEYDDEDARFRRQKGGGIVIDALTRLSVVEEELGISFEAPEFETLNGYLTAKLGHIPEKEDMDATIEAAGFSFTILSLGTRTIGKVRAQAITGPQVATPSEAGKEESLSLEDRK